MWITDSKASVHMTGNKELFSSYDAPCSGTLQIADGSLCGSWKDYMKLSNMIMLHAPKLSCNLISIKKLIMDLNCSAKFLICTQGRWMDRAKMCDGLYYLADTRPTVAPASNFTANTWDILQWHKQLGHPLFVYHQTLFPSLNKDFHSLLCKSCILGKQTRSHYRSKNYVLLTLLSLVVMSGVHLKGQMYLAQNGFSLLLQITYAFVRFIF